VNTAASVTNAAEELAAEVCRQLYLDPHRLVLIEHYGYADGTSGQPRGFDRVTFDAAASVGLTFLNPSWQPMTDADWADLGLPARPPVQYDAKGLPVSSDPAEATR
ncbi:MAG TPA: hypothetical protein PJ982_10170, partial [Lacipirellulaceae bacterium]|nr:hypothetical protein [Lacipirellulaceae bacterium]